MLNEPQGDLEIQPVVLVFQVEVHIAQDALQPGQKCIALDIQTPGSLRGIHAGIQIDAQAVAIGDRGGLIMLCKLHNAIGAEQARGQDAAPELKKVLQRVVFKVMQGLAVLPVAHQVQGKFRLMIIGL